MQSYRAGGTADFPAPPLPNVFSGSLLADTALPELEDNVAVARFLKERALGDLGGRAIVGPSPEGDEMLADMMASETAAALERKDRPTSADWYTSAIGRMTAVLALVHPEIGCDEAAAAHPSDLFRDAREARTVLFAAMAITSQNVPVFDNMRYALEQYRAFCEHGAFRPRAYGTAGLSVANNLARFNLIHERAGGDLTRVARLLSMKMKMGEFRAAAKEFGINVPGRELAGETVYGSMVFGPKVGNGFYQNLIGNHQPVTIDLWFMRLWGRYTGTLVGDGLPQELRPRMVKGLRRSMRSARMRALMEEEGVAIDPARVHDMDAQELLDHSRELHRFWERLRRRFVNGATSSTYTHRPAGSRGAGMTNEEVSQMKADLIWPGAAEAAIKSIGMPIDSPRNAAMRKWMRDVCAKSIDKLKGFGYDLTPADMQAILWFPEKEIYGKLTGRPMDRFIVSYDDAAVLAAKEKGVPHERIEAALRSAGENGKRRHRVPERSGLGPQGGYGGIRGQAPDDGGRGGFPVGHAGERDNGLTTIGPS